MRNSFSLLAMVVMTGALASGCANMENKLGRGMRNSTEIVRGGELRRSMETSMVTDSPDVAYTTGFVRGFNRTVGRTAIGLYEIVTFPFPPYGPVATRTFRPDPVYPDNYTPGLVADSVFETDTYVGYSGGEVAPLVPGSRFRIFEGP